MLLVQGLGGRAGAYLCLSSQPLWFTLFPGGCVQLLRGEQSRGNCYRNVNGSPAQSLFSFIALSKTSPNPPGRWARPLGATAAQTGRDDHALSQLRGVLVWVPPKTEAEIRLWVQVVYLRDGPWNELGSREHGKDRKGKGTRKSQY